MSKVRNELKKLPPEVKEKINSLYGNTDKFYATVYLIAKNEHMLQEMKPAAWEQKIKTVHAYQGMIRFMLDEAGLSGKDIMADIASDYLEDYVQYQDKDFGMTNEEFIAILKRIS